jgi:cellulose synthase/poly-beta-1,6-N-acetylglucosamine synthase-like glycosyltransferase
MSAQPVAEAARRYFSGRLVYRVEGRQNIALARNCALANATGDYLAFIDDDEFPEPHWLATLLAACERYGADGILAPVNPHFDQPPPPWLLKGGFFDRPQHPTGHRMEWQHCRTGNVLLKRSAVASSGLTFRVELGSGGEDRDFFRRLIGAGYTFVWCEEAAVSEVVPPSRWKRSTLLRRALLRGKMSLRQRSGRVRQVLASCVAVPAYVLALPFLALAGQHRSMKCLIKLCDHAGRLLAVLGLNPVTEVYVTE